MTRSFIKFLLIVLRKSWRSDSWQNVFFDVNLLAFCWLLERPLYRFNFPVHFLLRVSRVAFPSRLIRVQEEMCKIGIIFSLFFSVTDTGRNVIATSCPIRQTVTRIKMRFKGIDADTKSDFCWRVETSGGKSGNEACIFEWGFVWVGEALDAANRFLQKSTKQTPISGHLSTDPHFTISKRVDRFLFSITEPSNTGCGQHK